MKRKLKRVAPPFILLVDVLFQILFVFMTQRTPGIQIKIPENALFPGEYIVHQLPQGLAYFNGQTFVPFDEKQGVNFYFERECVGNICDQAYQAVSPGEHITVAITGKLFTDLSQLTFLACNTSAAQCSNIRYDILVDGTIDKAALLRYNPIFHKIPGLSAF